MVSKDTYLKYGSYFLIAIFVLSTAAIYFGNFKSDTQAPPQAQAISGTATANATLVSYGPQLELSGDSPELAAYISALKKNGTVIQDLKLSGSRLLTLKDPSAIPDIYTRLNRMGVSAYADADLLTSNITLVSLNGTVVLEPHSFRQKLTPLLRPGDVVQISFSAQLVDSALYPVSALSVSSGTSHNALLQARTATVERFELQIRIPWEDRARDYSAFLANRSANLTTASYITFSSPLPDSALQQISLQKPAYMSSITPTLIAINPRYADRAQLQSFLAPYGGASAQFPPSVIRMDADARDYAGIEEAFRSEFPNVSADFVPAYTVRLELPSEFSAGNVSYILPPNASARVVMDREPLGPVMANVTFVSVGSRVASYEVSSAYELAYNPVQTSGG